MKRLVRATLATAALTFIYGFSAGAQTQRPAVTDKDPQVTINGCIQREADWQKANDKGRGGAVETSVGAGNEFVLANVWDAKAAASPAFALTGPHEMMAAAHVGHRVEVTGTVKSGSATAGPTAGAPPRGTDVDSKDLQLRELEVSGIKMISAECKEP